jgi:AcrR family transcriptional regulator
VAESLSRRERKKLETHQALLTAALSLFRGKGYDATRVEEITERADVAKGTFFNYFPSKESLLGDLAQWSVEQLRAAVDVEQGAPASPVIRIKLLVRILHEQARQDIDLIHRAFVAQLYAPPPAPDGGKRQRFGLFLELVVEAQDCGEIRADVAAELVSDLLGFSFVRQLPALHAPDDDPSAAEDAGQAVDLLLEGLAGPRWRPGTDP